MKITLISCRYGVMKFDLNDFRAIYPIGGLYSYDITSFLFRVFLKFHPLPDVIWDDETTVDVEIDSRFSNLGGVYLFTHPEHFNTSLSPYMFFYKGRPDAFILQTIQDKGIKNSVVVLDHPEAFLHPDHQYQMVNDLWDLEPSNQYLIGTQSYEICQPLTKYHIKEVDDVIHPYPIRLRT